MEFMDDNQRHFLAGKKIIIAGGGIAALSFVASLNQLWRSSLEPPSITIFERDAENIKHQREDYSLSLAGYDSSGGLFALKNMKLLDEVCSHAISGLNGTDSFKLWGPDMKEKLSVRRKPADGLPSPSIRITRKNLRQVLLSNTGTGTMIQWQSECFSMTRNGDGGMIVHVLRAGQEKVEQHSCDILIVADGASSKLRSLFRPDDKLQYAGAVLRGGLSRFNGPLPTPLKGEWGFVLSGTGVSCFYSPVDDHSILWAVGHLEKDEVPRLDLNSKDEAAAVIAHAQELGTPFQEPFNTVAAHTDIHAVMCINAKDKMPFSHHDTLADTPAVFIGDANHALSPFAGFGANLALADGWELALQLCSSKSLIEAVRRYDAVAVPRAARILQASKARLRAGHSTGLRLWLFLFLLAVKRCMARVLRRR